LSLVPGCFNDPLPEELYIAKTTVRTDAPEDVIEAYLIVGMSSSPSGLDKYSPSGAFSRKPVGFVIGSSEGGSPLEELFDSAAIYDSGAPWKNSRLGFDTNSGGHHFSDALSG
jgi:hypothetical protein